MSRLKLSAFVFMMLSFLGILPASSLGVTEKEKEATYRSVYAQKLSWSQANIVMEHFEVKVSPPLYVIRDGQLYLLIQVTWPEWGLVTRVKGENWTVSRLNEVIKDNDVRNLLPDKQQENGGIDWIDR